MQKRQVGDVEVFALVDGVVQLPVQMLFPEIAIGEWEPFRPEYVNNEQIDLTIAGFLIRSKTHKVLVDTGSGVAASSLELPTGGIEAGLRSLGVGPGDIDLVILTHMHADHVGGCTHFVDGIHKPFFPEAHYLVDEKEWEYWTQDERARSDPNASPEIIDACARPLELSGQLVLTSGVHSPAPNITLVPAPGHTPGHLNVLVHSQGEQLLIVGDCLHCPAQIVNPEWSIYAGVDKEMERHSRHEVLHKIAAERMIMAAGHLVHANFGEVLKDREGLRFRAIR